ncbi:MAG: hypothetical protein ACM3MF_03740, partial [Anaerolineae bacterium]
MKVLLRRLLTLDAVSLALTCTALACLPISLRDTAPDAALTLLFPLMLVGVLGAAVIWASTRFSSAARAGFILCGLLLIFLRVGQLGSVLLAADSTLRLIAALLLPLGAAGIQLDEVGRWLAAQAVAWADVSDFAYRSWTWLAGVLRGSTAQDPAARALFLAIGIWLLSIWAGWRALTKRDVLGGLLPVTVSVAIVLDITAQNRWPLWLHVAALLFLLGLTELSRLTKSWRREHRDYSDSIPEDLLFAATLLSLLILTAAFAVSSFSLKDFIDRFRQPEPVAASASSSRHTSGGSVRTGITGLQDAHFISAGPSLTQDVVMYVSTGDLPPIQHALDAPVPRYYWRAETYQYYSGRGWHNPIRHDLQVPAGAVVIPVDANGYRPIHASVAIPGGLNGAAY